jgi:hypothetical protein
VRRWRRRLKFEDGEVLRGRLRELVCSVQVPGDSHQLNNRRGTLVAKRVGDNADRW